MPKSAFKKSKIKFRKEDSEYKLKFKKDKDLKKAINFYKTELNPIIINNKSNNTVKNEIIPTYKVLYDSGPELNTYNDKPVDWSGFKRSTNVIGGGLLLGPAGAVVGAAISDDKKPEEKIVHDYVHKTDTYKNCMIDLDEEKLTFSNNKWSWTIYYDEILNSKIMKSNEFLIRKTDYSKFVFKTEKHSYISHMNEIFNNLENELSKLPEPEYMDKSEVVSGEVINEWVNPEFENDFDENESIEDPFESIKKLKELKKEGIISKEEFEKKKKELLDRI